MFPLSYLYIDTWYIYRNMLIDFPCYLDFSDGSVTDLGVRERVSCASPKNDAAQSVPTPIQSAGLSNSQYRFVLYRYVCMVKWIQASVHPVWKEEICESLLVNIYCWRF